MKCELKHAVNSAPTEKGSYHSSLQTTWMTLNTEECVSLRMQKSPLYLKAVADNLTTKGGGAMEELFFTTLTRLDQRYAWEGKKER